MLESLTHPFDLASVSESLECSYRLELVLSNTQQRFNYESMIELKDLRRHFEASRAVREQDLSALADVSGALRKLQALYDTLSAEKGDKSYKPAHISSELEELQRYSDKLRIAKERDLRALEGVATKLGPLRLRYDALCSAKERDAGTTADVGTRLEELRARCDAAFALEKHNPDRIANISSVLQDFQHRYGALSEIKEQDIRSIAIASAELDQLRQLYDELHAVKEQDLRELFIISSALDDYRAWCKLPTNERHFRTKSSPNEEPKEPLWSATPQLDAIEEVDAVSTQYLVVKLEEKLQHAESRYRDLESLFLAQIKQLITQTRTEREHIQTLAEVVRTSKFWKIKRFLRRLASER